MQKYICICRNMYYLCIRKTIKTGYMETTTNPNKQVKLSAAQMEVIRLLQSGEWELDVFKSKMSKAVLTNRVGMMRVYPQDILRGLTSGILSETETRFRYIYRLTQAGREIQV